MYGIRFLSNKAAPISRFTVNSYAPIQERVETVKKQRTYFTMTFRQAAPIIMGGGLLMAFLVYCVVGVGWISIVSSLAGLLFPKVYVDWRIASKNLEMEKELEQAMETMGTVLRSGGSLPEAFERAAVDAKTPLNVYLMECGTRMRTGVNQAEAVREFQNKVQVKELNIINVGMRLIDTGVPISMSEIFFDVQRCILQRIDFKRQVRVIVSENKIAGWVVGVMPFLMLGGLRQMAPEMMEPLFATQIGLVVFALGTAMIFFGVYVVLQIATSDI